VARRRNVLLVETNRDIQSAISELLRGTPFRLRAYSDRWAAFRALKRTREFDIVLIDKDMACIGVEQALFVSMLRNLKKDMDVIVLSESFPAQRSSELTLRGFKEYLSKAELDSRLLPALHSKLPPVPRPSRSRVRRKTAARRKTRTSTCETDRSRKKTRRYAAAVR